MSGPECPSCGRPLGRRLATCPYCGERVPGATWRIAAPAIALAAALGVQASALARLGPRKFFGALRALPHIPWAPLLLTLAAIALFAPFPRPRPGTASEGRARRVAAIAIRVIVLLLLAMFMCESVQ